MDINYTDEMWEEHLKSLPQIRPSQIKSGDIIYLDLIADANTQQGDEKYGEHKYRPAMVIDPIYMQPKAEDFYVDTHIEELKNTLYIVPLTTKKPLDTLYKKHNIPTKSFLSSKDVFKLREDSYLKVGDIFKLDSSFLNDPKTQNMMILKMQHMPDEMTKDLGDRIFYQHIRFKREKFTQDFIKESGKNWMNSSQIFDKNKVHLIKDQTVEGYNQKNPNSKRYKPKLPTKNFKDTRPAIKNDGPEL